MSGRCLRGAVFLLSAALVVPMAGGAPAMAAPVAPAAVADGNGGLLMVLDSSGSMAEDDGSGSTRIESARKAVEAVVDALPDGHPTGLRLYGSEQESGCTDTRLARPVMKLDRDSLKSAVHAVRPKGDTPTGLALRKAAEDLPEASGQGVGRRTILLVSDGESNCADIDPCEVAEQITEDGVDLRIDTVGFQVGGKARKELECIAEAGHGSYYDAPDAASLARQLQRAGELSAGGYRLSGDRVTGGRSAGKAAGLTAGQYLDTIGAGETRWYAADLDAGSAVDFAATAVPQPGAAVHALDGLVVRLEGGDDNSRGCAVSSNAYFRQGEGALPVSGAVSRVPTERGTARCDTAGRYVMSVQRRSKPDSDQARWPLELRLGEEEPLPDGVVPGASLTDYGQAGRDARLPTGTPKDVEGGTGFNDARQLGSGVWRDRLLPGQTRWYKVPVGWGQQLRFDAEFGNEPTLEDSRARSFVRADLFTPGRRPVPSGTEFQDNRSYAGRPTAVSSGTVPVSWTNRWETGNTVTPVRADGDYYLAVSLGPDAADLAENPAIGLVLRVDVVGEAKAGPAHDAPPADADTADDAGPGKDAGGEGEAAGTDGAGWSTPMLAGIAGGAAVLLLAGLGAAYALSRRRRATAPHSSTTDSTRGGTA
ncbi:VWA domain-containing protein [Streptomyces sp. 549]|uniref:vWA domain-containing protein n=1 Tax=Streptomyces sp. 549 TaxID=3049076 RepID=UPI0024C2308E|nr:VWA domain-containing protein [Streptomyces sp. 549]MDK1473273.1 VWA domain-containing protein [Streptomyces sp. 549]